MQSPMPASLTPILQPTIPASVKPTKSGKSLRLARSMRVWPRMPLSQSQFCPISAPPWAVASGISPNAVQPSATVPAPAEAAASPAKTA